MAEKVKKSKDSKESKGEEIQGIKEKKRSKKPFMIVFIIVILMTGIWAVIRFNVGNVTEKYVRPSIEKVPIINNLLLPKKAGEDKYASFSKEQLIQQIEDIQKTLGQKEQVLNMDKDTIGKLEDEIKRLQEIENQQVQYKEDKQKFDEMVASQNPTEFKKYYKDMYPDNAAAIYERMVGEDTKIKNIKKYAEPFQTMDPSNAASVFEEMVATDIDLVVLILNNIDSEQQAAILGEMKPTEAAKVVKKRAPQ